RELVRMRRRKGRTRRDMHLLVIQTLRRLPLIKKRKRTSFAEKKKKINMPSLSWPIFLGKALYGAEGHTEDTGEIIVARLDGFARRWGGFDVEAFQRALSGSDNDRLFALFAFGYLVSLHSMTELVTPFLDVSFAKERWASTITLGRWKQ